jgi:hypothetical protein
MDLFTKITNVYPELTDLDFDRSEGSILLQDDGDGIQYIAKWEYNQPLPEDTKLGK